MWGASLGRVQAKPAYSGGASSLFGRFALSGGLTPLSWIENKLPNQTLTTPDQEYQPALLLSAKFLLAAIDAVLSQET